MGIRGTAAIAPGEVEAGEMDDVDTMDGMDTMDTMDDTDKGKLRRVRDCGTRGAGADPTFGRVGKLV